MSPFTPACSSQLVSFFFATCGKSKLVPRHSLSRAVSFGPTVCEKIIHLPPCFHPEEKGKGSPGTWPGRGKKKVLKRTFPRKTPSEKECQVGAKKTPTKKKESRPWKARSNKKGSGRNKLCREDPEVISRILTAALFAYVKVYYLSTYGESGLLLFLVCGRRKKARLLLSSSNNPPSSSSSSSPISRRTREFFPLTVCFCHPPLCPPLLSIIPRYPNMQ